VVKSSSGRFDGRSEKRLGVMILDFFTDGTDYVVGELWEQRSTA